ncbi:MAG: hypothetical protein ACE5DI_04375 [Candidatus Micrarchaeia archaeon]
MKEKILIVVVGKEKTAFENLFASIKHFPIQKVAIITEEKNKEFADKIKNELAKLKIPTEYLVVDELSFDAIFKSFAIAKEQYNEENLVTNIDTDRKTRCISLSAAFVNGFPAIGIINNKIIAYPIMKFSYYKALSDRKMAILKSVQEEQEVDSLEKLSRKTQMSLPLIMYHLYGTAEKAGLEKLGLVETQKNKGRVNVKLTTLGKLILGGSIERVKK